MLHTGEMRVIGLNFFVTEQKLEEKNKEKVKMRRKDIYEQVKRNSTNK